MRELKIKANEKDTRNLRVYLKGKEVSGICTEITFLDEIDAEGFQEKNEMIKEMKKEFNLQ